MSKSCKKPTHIWLALALSLSASAGAACTVFDLPGALPAAEKEPICAALAAAAGPHPDGPPTRETLSQIMVAALQQLYPENPNWSGPIALEHLEDGIRFATTMGSDQSSPLLVDRRLRLSLPFEPTCEGDAAAVTCRFVLRVVDEGGGPAFVSPRDALAAQVLGTSGELHFSQVELYLTRSEGRWSSLDAPVAVAIAVSQ